MKVTQQEIDQRNKNAQNYIDEVKWRREQKIWLRVISGMIILSAVGMLITFFGMI